MLNSETQFTTAVDQDTFRDVISNLVSGVSIISAQREDERFGVTASSVTSLSVDPASILVCLNQRLSITDVISETGVFAVNILGEGHGDVAIQFATGHADKFRGTTIRHDGMGNPILADALAHLECRVVERKDFTTHAIFIALVESAVARPGSPLPYFRKSFGRFTED